MAEVIISNSKTDEEYGIQSGDFRRGKHYRMPDGTMSTFEEAGFRIVSHMTGEPYEPPAPRHPVAEQGKD